VGEREGFKTALCQFYFETRGRGKKKEKERKKGEPPAQDPDVTEGSSRGGGGGEKSRRPLRLSFGNGGGKEKKEVSCKLSHIRRRKEGLVQIYTIGERVRGEREGGKPHYLGEIFQGEKKGEKMGGFCPVVQSFFVKKKEEGITSFGANTQVEPDEKGGKKKKVKSLMKREEGGGGKRG